MIKTATERFVARARQDGWWGHPVALALSGGGDSTALLLLTLASGVRPAMAFHLDHGLRPSSADECRRVRERCEALGVPCVFERIDVAAERHVGESLEVACRRLRYGFFERHARSAGVPFVALAHTASDQAETVLMNLCRGSGLWGLAGIPRRRGQWVRPLLDFTRDELRECLREARWDWVEDESNDDCRFTRNRVRHQVLPLLVRELNGATSRHLVELAGEAWAFREDESRLMRLLTAPWRRPVPAPFAAVSLQGLRGISDGLMARVLRQLGREAGGAVLERRRTERLIELVRRSGRWSFQWDRNHELIARDGLALWGPSPERRNGRCVIESTGARWGGWHVSWAVGEAGLWDVILSCDDALVELVRRPGDWSAHFLPAVTVGGEIFATPSVGGWAYARRGVEYKNMRLLRFSPMEVSGG